MKTKALPAAVALACALVLSPTSARAGAQQEAAPPKAEAETTDLRARVAELERRLQLLEQAMVEKDARIAELQARLNQRGGGPGMELPEFRFRINPEELQPHMRELEDFLRGRLDRGWDDEPKGQPWEREALGAPKPRLGVALQDATPELAARYKNDVKTGAFITEVQPDSVAEKAGLMPGDCVLNFDNKPIEGAQDLVETVRAAPEGRHGLIVKRRGEELALQINLDKPAAAPFPEAPQRGWWRGRDRAAGRMGKETVEVKASALELTPQLAEALKLDDQQRKKMEEVLAAHSKKLSEEYAEQTAAGRRGLLAVNTDPTALIRKHGAAAEDELRGTLTEEQLRIWRDWRARRQGVSISRHLETGPQGQPQEGLEF